MPAMRNFPFLDILTPGYTFLLTTFCCIEGKHFALCYGKYEMIYLDYGQTLKS